MTSPRAGHDSKPATAGVGSFCLTGFIGAALILFVVFLVALLGLIRRDDAFGLEQLQGHGQSLAQQLADRLVPVEQRLTQWGRDPLLRQTLQTRDPALFEATEARLSEQLPNRPRVRLLLSDGQELPGRERPGLGFAGLDLIQQAVREQTVSPLEAHGTGNVDGHLAIVAPVLDEQARRVVGVAHVALPMDRLPVPAAAVDAVGRILYQQQAGDLLVVVGPADGDDDGDGDGDGDDVGDAADLSIEIPGTRLRISAWLHRESPLDPRTLLPFAVAYLTATLLIGVLMWWSARRLRRALADDYTGILSMAEGVVAGEPPCRFECNVGETRALYDQLIRLLRKQPRGSADASEAEPEAESRPEPTAPAVSAASSGNTERPVAPIAAASPAAASTASPTQGEQTALPDEIFRAYDVRGVVGEGLTAAVARRIGYAVGRQAQAQGHATVFVARDTRESGEDLTRALTDGLIATGREVRDLGVVPTPLLYFAARNHETTSGVMVTASHNPPEYNGLKVVLAGRSISGEEVKEWCAAAPPEASAEGNGRMLREEIVPGYIEHVEHTIALARTMKIVVDCGHATACRVAPDLFRALGCDVIALSCDMRQGFPDGKVPDPAVPDNLAALSERVVTDGADLGIGFDGDGDRLGVVDSAGQVVTADRVLMVLAADMLSRHPGTDIIYDIKCSHHLGAEILRAGGRPVMTRSGHALIKAGMRESGALLGGEFSGHIMFQERWFGFDDACYAGARLLEVLALDTRPSAEVFGALPRSIATPELLLPLAEGESARIMDRVRHMAGRLEGVRVKTIDGLRAEFDQGWGLVRASNTRPALMFRFEANDEQSLVSIKELFRRLMGRAAPELRLPF